MQSKLTKQFIHNIVFMLMLNALAWTQHFEPVWHGQTDNPIARHALNITLAILDDADLQTGDEIGIFDGTTCVGAGTVNGIISLENMLVVKASKAQGDIPGYTVGEPIYFAIGTQVLKWRSRTLRQIF